MILCLSLDAAPSLPPSAAESLFQAGQLGLHLAEWESTPRIRSIQVSPSICPARIQSLITITGDHCLLSIPSTQFSEQHSVATRRLATARCMAWWCSTDCDGAGTEPTRYQPRNVSLSSLRWSLLTHNPVASQNASRRHCISVGKECRKTGASETTLGDPRLHRLDVAFSRSESTSIVSHSSIGL